MATAAEPHRSLRTRGIVGANLGDRAFRWGTFLFAAAVLVLVAWLIWELAGKSLPAMREFGWRFLISQTWNPVRHIYGALPVIYGTLVSSFLALLIAVPISLGTAVFLAELAPPGLRGPVSFVVELLAAVPSVVYGLWGIFVVLPILRPIQAWLADHLGFIPLFHGTPMGLGMMAAGVVLAIMIIPYITAVSREVIQAVPVSQREAAYALGATRWEAIRGPVFRYARAGILGGITLGLGRALGETMAVTMLIGNVPHISASLLDLFATMASLLANQFAEATDPLEKSALIEVALLLLVLTVIVNALARLLIWTVARGSAREAVRE
jgi:phosphate transport system permease protein